MTCVLYCIFFSVNIAISDQMVFRVIYSFNYFCFVLECSVNLYVKSNGSRSYRILISLGASEVDDQKLAKEYLHHK